MSAHREPVYTFVAIGYGDSRKHLGSVYTSVSKCLLRKRHWRRKRSPVLTPTVHLVFGEALGRGVNYARFRTLRSALDPLVNYAENFTVICRKAEQISTLRQYARASGEDVARLLPPSFAVSPSSPAGRDWDAFEAAAAAHAANGADVWILKPSDGAKGQRIVLARGVDGVRAKLAEFSDRVPVVIQKYIERPFLLPGRRKFDVRCWVLLTHDHRVLMYRQGVLRTGSVPFSLADLDDSFVHLSNHCIQVDHDSFGAHEPTNEMFYAEFDSLLRAQGRSLDEAVLPQFDWLALHTLRAAADSLAPPRGAGYRAFHLFGFDFMVDDRLGAHLIEVNSSPAVAAQLLPALSEDLIEAAIDPVFPPPTPPQENARASRLPPDAATVPAARAGRPVPMSPARRVRAAIGRLLRSPTASARPRDFADGFSDIAAPAPPVPTVSPAPAASSPVSLRHAPLGTATHDTRLREEIEKLWFAPDAAKAKSLPVDWEERGWSLEIMARRGFKAVGRL